MRISFFLMFLWLHNRQDDYFIVDAGLIFLELFGSMAKIVNHFVVIWKSDTN